MRVLIVGGGIVGLSAAWAAARRGWEPVVFDQGPIPNPRAASHDEHRLIRYPYGERQGYTAMVSQAFAAWELLWAELGERHYSETGALALGLEPDDWTARSLATLRALDLRHEVLDSHEVAARAPMLAPPAGAWGLYTPHGGMLFAERILRALTHHLERRGVELRPESTVAGIDPEAAAIRLAGGGQERGDALVLAAGAWTGKLRPTLAAEAEPYRQALAYLRPPAAWTEAWFEAPVLLELNPAYDLYIAPPRRGTGLKLGYRGHRRPGDPDDPREPLAGEADDITAPFRDVLRDFDDYRAERCVVCYYAMNLDNRFAVEARDGFLAVTGCSGHMFKFGALMGLEIARTLAGAQTPEAFARWAAGRA